MEEIIKLHTEMCKSFANPQRLRIIKLLCDSELSAGDLIRKTKMSKANLSQHMSKLVGSGVAVSRRRSRNIYYRVSDSRISKACKLMQAVIVDNIKKKNKRISRI